MLRTIYCISISVVVFIDIFCLFFIKTKKIQEHDDLCKNQIVHHFYQQIFFIGLIINNLQKKGGGAGGSAQFFLGSEYSSSLYISILITPGIFLI